MHPGEDKGTYAQGRGYTSYYDVPRVVCWTRHMHGCPHPLPEPDPENARCCFRPEYRLRRNAPPKWRECETCGAFAPKLAYTELNKLPVLSGVSCRHTAAAVGFLGYHECMIYDYKNNTLTGGCGGFWDHPPASFELPQYSLEDIAKRGIPKRDDGKP